MPLVAFCGGVRVLAAADVIAGRLVTGHDLYVDEYEAAGATWVGDDVPPVVDGTIITTVRGQYHSVQICEVIAEVIESRMQGGE